MYRAFRSVLPHPSYFATAHTRDLVRGLDFNPIQTNLLSSGAVNSEVSTMIYVVVCSVLSDFYGSTSAISKTSAAGLSKSDEITSISWNQLILHVLVSSSGTGYTTIWDLRNKRGVALAYDGAGQVGIIVGARRRGMSMMLHSSLTM